MSHSSRGSMCTDVRSLREEATWGTDDVFLLYPTWRGYEPNVFFQASPVKRGLPQAGISRSCTKSLFLFLSHLCFSSASTDHDFSPIQRTAWAAPFPTLQSGKREGKEKLRNLKIVRNLFS